MKKLLLSLLCFTSAAAYSQLEKGARLAGLQTNAVINDALYSARLTFEPGSDDYGINIIPTFGYALKRNWLVGAQAVFGLESVRPNAYNRENYTDLGIAPFTRFYLDLTRNHKLKFFGIAAFEIVTKWTKHTVGGGSSPAISRSSNTNASGSIGGGFAYFWRNCAIDVSMNTSALRFGLYKTIALRKK